MDTYEHNILDKLIRFGEGRDVIRAMVLTSSLCNPDAPSDILSDFDIEFFFEDPAMFAERDGWINEIGLGPVMAIWHWPNSWDSDKGDGHRWVRMVYFHDGTKMDISLCFLADLQEISKADSLPDGYDIGYKVLLDKDDVTSTLKPPTHRAYVITQPTKDQFISRIEAFWMNSTYVAKYLWRDDLIAAKWRLHELADGGVRELLEWSVAMKHDWQWKPGCLGRGLLQVLDTATRKELLNSYAAGEIEDMWNSLFKTTALFRQTAIKIADRLDFPYPHSLDGQVTAYHQALRHLNRQTGTREELARLLNA